MILQPPPSEEPAQLLEYVIKHLGAMPPRNFIAKAGTGLYELVTEDDAMRCPSKPWAITEATRAGARSFEIISTAGKVVYTTEIKKVAKA